MKRLLIILLLIPVLIFGQSHTSIWVRNLNLIYPLNATDSLMVGYNTSQGYRFAVNGTGYFNGNLKATTYGTALVTDEELGYVDGATSNIQDQIDNKISGNETITLSGDISGSGATSITTTIGSDKILESMLKSVNAPTDEYVLTYESTTGDFEWQEQSGGSSLFTESGGNLSPTTTTNSINIATGESYKINGNRVLFYEATSNLYVGENAGNTSQTGNYNVAIGDATTLSSNTSGGNNYAIGNSSLQDNTTGADNTSVGSGSLANSIDGNSNTAIGKQALQYMASASSYNIGIGAVSGLLRRGSSTLTSATSSTFIGYNTWANDNSETNQTVIGANAIGNGSNTVTIGDDNVTDIYMAEDSSATVHAASGVYSANVTASTYGSGEVTDTELGYLDGATSNIQTQISSITRLSYTKQTLNSTSVGNLGSAQTLIAAQGAGTAIMVTEIYVKIDAGGGQLEVGIQDLEIRIGSNPIYSLSNSNVESTGENLLTCTKSLTEYVIAENTALTVILDDSTNPTSGTASMDFHITYKVISY